MKKIILATALASVTMLSACTGDLDRIPQVASDFTAEVAYDSPESYAQGLAKIYGGFVLVGQGDPGTSEITVANAGASELTRAWWSLQEMSTDAGKAAWVNDAWTREVNTNTWTTFKNDALAAIYERTILTVALVNEYLRQTADDRLAARGVDAALKTTIQRYRAEARFLRAYSYWMLMDAFGNPPFVTEADLPGAFKPRQIARADLFTWIEGELKALTESPDLPAIGAASYPQVDKGAAWGLLARIYLNAAVYTGTARWADAKSAAEQVIGSRQYELANNYAQLFMDDNGQTQAASEMIFAIDYDNLRTQSWGGTTVIVNGSLAADDEQKVNGAEGWGGYHVDFSYVQKFGVTNADYDAGTYDSPDKRAMFYIQGRTPDMDDPGVFKQGWSCVKYSRISSTGVLESGSFSSADFPMMRLAEMYLIYAEATLRAAGGSSSTDVTALGYLNELRQRAGLPAIPSGSFDLAYLIDERARELMWESHRRTDLIRYGFYTGDAYLWPWKGGARHGRSIDAHYNLCPLLQEDVKINDNLVQNPGYIE